MSAEWEHFAEWKKINSEGEKGVVSLKTMIRGTCEPGRLLDLVENFTLFKEARGGLIKLVAKNHQYLGVNNAIAALREIGHSQGKLGVFWHTQGSGKSVSMIFFAQKVLRKVPGNWTFVVVTDRQELDDQIYKEFAATGAVGEKQAQATSGKHLEQLLRENHRYVFTLIQKFHAERGQKYPTLSDRSDIIVVTDEAHRSQYDIFAVNVRNALPRAAFIGFTGTPLMAGEEKTREVFGNYVSVYNFRQSVEDRATVPLYYENRVPELQLTNPDLNSDMERLLDDAVEALIVNDESKRRYLLLAADVARLYKAILPDPTAATFAPACVLLAVMAEKIRSLTPPADITAVMAQVEQLLDRSVASEGYVIRESPSPYTTSGSIDLSQIDFEALKARFEQGRKRTEAERLRGTVHSKLQKLIRLNRTRMDFLAKFQEMIDAYNAGSLNVEDFFRQLVAFAQHLNQEEKRHVSEQLSEEELALFDLLTKPTIKLTKKEARQVKKVAHELLQTLKSEKLVLDWRKKQQARAAVQVCIRDSLEQLPAAFTAELREQKGALVYQHVYDSYLGEGRSIYPAA